MNKLNFRLLSVPLVVCLLGSSAMASEGTLLVANRTGGSISFIDLPTGVEIARVPVGPSIPHEVAVSPDGRLALTAEYGPDSNRGGHLILIDVEGARILARIDLGPNSRPHTALFLPDGRRAVATMQDSDQLALVDLETRAVVRTYPTGGREGHMVRLSPDGSRAYVTSRLGPGTLSVVFLDEERPPMVIETGPGAEGLDVTPDGREVWVINRRNESISIIDTQSLEIAATINARPFAGRIDMGPDGRAIVPNGTSSEQVPQYLRVYDVESREVLTEVALRDGQSQAGNFGVLIQDGLAFASDPRAGTIKVFNLDAMGTWEVLVTDHEGPDGMAWSPIRVNVMTEDANR